MSKEAKINDFEVIGKKLMIANLIKFKILNLVPANLFSLLVPLKTRCKNLSKYISDEACSGIVLNSNSDELLKIENNYTMLMCSLSFCRRNILTSLIIWP